jgi:hypothetical protein
MMQVVARLLPAVAPYFRSHAVMGEVPLLALLAVATSTSQVPALSRAALSSTDDDWLNGWRASEFSADDESCEDEEKEEGQEAGIAFHRRRFNCGVARVAMRLLVLAPSAVPEIVLFPCPDGRTVDIARVAAATQPAAVRRLALCNAGESEVDQSDAVEIWKIACATWGPSSLRDLRIKDLPRDPPAFEQAELLSVATAHCPHLEVLHIPRIILPSSFVASLTEGASASSPDAATPIDDLCGPLPAARCVNARLPPSPRFAPYAATLRSLELSHGPDNAAEFAFIATQLPSLRCLILAAEVRSAGRISSGVWRRGLRQLLRQLHKLYVFSLDGPLSRALNTLHDLAAVDAQRGTALRLTPGAMATILQSDSDETDGSDDDTSIPVDAGCTTATDLIPTEDVPLQVFSIFGFSARGPYSIAPFVRYLGQHAPFLTEVGLNRTTGDAAAELITMRSACRAVALRDINGLTDTIVASILQQHRATLRQILVEDVIAFTGANIMAEFDPRAYMAVLGDKDTPQGAPFTKIASAGMHHLAWSDQQREYFSYLFPGLCNPQKIGLHLLLD